MAMEIQGYKAFNKGLTNRYGMKFNEGEIYSIDGDLRFGNNGNGFHFCKRMEDTLRYFPGMEEEIDIARITSLGNLVESEDDYYGYYDMFCTDKIRIDKKLSREEIIKMYLDMPDYRVIRFIQGFKLSDFEIELFKLRYGDDEKIMKTIAYYQLGDKDVYNTSKII